VLVLLQWLLLYQQWRLRIDAYLHSKQLGNVQEPLP
jgi:hypothetical protein